MRSLAGRASNIVPAVVLLAVAGFQAIRVETHDQSPWVGGGFAMFTYVDSDQYRPIVAFETRDPSVRLGIPSDLALAAERLKSAPTDERAARFADLLAADSGREVRVEIWRPLFDSDSLTVGAELIAAGTSQ